MVSVTHSLDGPFDHRRDCTAPPAGVRAPERGRSAGRGEPLSQEAGVRAAGFSSAVLGLASCPLARGNPLDLIIKA